MHENIYAVLRNGRTLCQMAAEPLDWCARRLNAKDSQPPLFIRQAVGNLNDFDGSVGEYTAYLKLLAGLQPDHFLLDLGCGCGTILYNTTGAGSLLSYLKAYGCYVGIDIDAKAIRWCKKRFADEPAFFIQADTIPAWMYLDTCPKVDTVLAKSIFTHLVPHKMLTYVEQLSHIVKPGGKILSTWFILNGDPITGPLTFSYQDAGNEWALQRKSKPDLAVAYEPNLLQDTFQMYGFDFEVYLGTWRGNTNGLSFQDIIILTRKEN